MDVLASEWVNRKTVNFRLVSVAKKRLSLSSPLPGGGRRILE